MDSQAELKKSWLDHGCQDDLRAAEAHLACGARVLADNVRFGKLEWGWAQSLLVFFLD